MHLATRPDTLGFALNDSPAGLAAYVLEKFVRGFGGTSCQKEDALKCIESRVSLDELLTNIMIYWDTNSMPSALRLYKEAVNSENRMLQRFVLPLIFYLPLQGCRQSFPDRGAKFPNKGARFQEACA